MIEENYLKFIEIDKIEIDKEYVNMVDIEVEGDESFCLSNGIISHNSAVTMAITGMSVPSVGHDYYGAFPLKGKVLNVRDASIQKIRNNEEIQNILNITGLEFGKKYKDTSELRYGKIVIMTDADVDGIHIKGLLMNFFESNWPELMKMDFLYEFITPVLKAKKGNQSRSFYTMKEYKTWISREPKGWSIKYYKGLGTSTPKESKEYFINLDQHLLPFKWDTDKNHDKIDLVFRTKRSNERKDWMLNISPKEVEKYETPTLISSFLDNEMIMFSLSDNIRSIPDIYDGLKPSQRKILYTVLKRNITKDYGVASLAGIIKDDTRYHHGEKSLEQGIVNLAQEFVGSNNIPLLEPVGAFGTRIHGGNDAASSRYINTHLADITKFIFDKKDNSILDMLIDDGYQIEPKTFKPIIPTLLINGAEGIGTGWSTTIPKYNPKDVIRVIENKLKGKKSNRIHPWYKGFNGEIKETDNGYITRGKFEVINTTTIKISELPIGMWTQKFTDLLYKLNEDKFIKSFENHSGDTEVDFTITLPRENMITISKEEDLISKFKLETRIYTSNMHLFVDDKITKFETIEEIVDVFYKKRLKDYGERKKSLLSILQKDKDKLDNQVRFIKEVIKGTLKINNRKRDLITKDLIKGKYDKYEDSYNYLLGMPIYSLTKEKVDELNGIVKSKESEIKELKKMKPKDLWLVDITELKKHI